MQQMSICGCRPKLSEEGRGEGKSGDRNLIKSRERREEEGRKKKEQVIVEQEACLTPQKISSQLEVKA